MTNLRCGVSNCVHNDEHLCCKKEIKVNGEGADHKDDTCCSSFCDCDGSTKNRSEGEAELETEIGCNVTNCVFNNCEKCGADCIEVAGVGASKPEGTLCSSFRGQ